MTQLPSTVRINEGEDLDLSCSITGETISCISISLLFFCKGTPEPVINWTKDDVDIREDHRIDIYSDRGVHHLEISDVVTADQGLYMIHAENALDKITAQCRIDVQENVDQVKRLKVEGLYAYGTR